MNIDRIVMVASFVLTIAGGTWWASQNLVFAESYNHDKRQQEVRWAQYDSDQLYREYNALKGFVDGPLKTARRIELERRIQDNNAKIESLRSAP